MEIAVRTATPRDLPTMVSIKHDAGVAAWPHILPPAVIERLPYPERWSAAVSDPDPRVSVLVSELEGEVVAFAVIRPSGDADAAEDTGELDAFFVAPHAWGVGVGRSVLANAVTALRSASFIEATLWTAELNDRPRRIYETAGWRLDGTERRRSFEGVEFVELRYRIKLDGAS